MPTQEQALYLYRCLVRCWTRSLDRYTFDEAIHGVGTDSRFFTEGKCFSKQFIGAHDHAVPDQFESRC